MAKKKSSSKKSAGAKRAGKSNVGIRYTDEQKAEIVQFVRDHDRANGRGGQSAAVKKYGASPISIASWLKKSGNEAKKETVAPPKKKVARKAVEKQAAAPSAGQVSGGGGGVTTLKRMMAIQEQIEALKAEYLVLKARL